jgi:hypothetical protein
MAAIFVPRILTYQHFNVIDRNVYTRDRYGLNGEKRARKHYKKKCILKNNHQSKIATCCSQVTLFFNLILLFVLVFLPQRMLPNILKNHFGYAIPDQIIPFYVGEGNDENSQL